jgi:hypothetical protein
LHLEERDREAAETSIRSIILFRLTTKLHQIVFFKTSVTAWVFPKQQKSHRFTNKFSSNLELGTTFQILAPHGRTISSTHQNMKSSNILLAV